VKTGKEKLLPGKVGMGKVGMEKEENRRKEK